VSGRHFAHVQDYLKCQDFSKKSHFFTWHLEKDRLPSSDNVGHADGSGALCGQSENVDHIFYLFSITF
jgi:hypothetical protein